MPPFTLDCMAHIHYQSEVFYIDLPYYNIGVWTLKFTQMLRISLRKLVTCFVLTKLVTVSFMVSPGW